MERFQKVALAALVSLFLLICMGAVVRVTGSGMGCPDWPTCWGCLIPPWNVEQVDFDKLDIEKFREKAERAGRDPATITRESLRAEFNPKHTWIEFINRLLSLPVGLFSLLTFIGGFRQWKRGRPLVCVTASLSLFVVLLNAWMGARIVYSGLKPGVITLHMALAMLLVCLLVYTAWRGTDRPWRRRFSGPSAKLRWLGGGLLLLTIVEGVFGSQVRELTDVLAKSHLGEARAEWIGELEGHAVYLIHRSFSWLIVLGTVVFLLSAHKVLRGGLGWLEKGIGLMVLAMMLMGLVLAQVGIHPVVQVLHVGMAAVMVGALCLWLLASSREPA